MMFGARGVTAAIDPVHRISWTSTPSGSKGAIVGSWWILLIPATGLIWFASRIAVTIPGLWLSTNQFNSTSDWTPAYPVDPTPLPAGASAQERGLQIIRSHLEPEERLEGYAFGYFAPPRPKDWGPQWRRQRHPLLIAVTPHRMLLFELTIRMVESRSRFVAYEAIQFLRPPQPGFMGTSRRMRFGLFSGHEYQVGFLGPIIDPEFLRQEQRLAAYLRWLAPRYASSRPRASDDPVGDSV